MFVRRRSSWLLHRCLLCRCLLSRCLLRGCRLRRLLGPLLLLWLLLRGLLNLLWRPLCLRLLLALLCLALLGLSLFALLVPAGCNRGGGLLAGSHARWSVSALAAATLCSACRAIARGRTTGRRAGPGVRSGASWSSLRRRRTGDRNIR